MTFGPIASLPSLLPSLFQMTGQNIPKAIEESMRPVLPVLDLLVPSQCLEIYRGGNINIGAIGYVNDPGTLVPVGEAWLVRGASVAGSTIAAELIRFMLVVGRTGGPGTIVVRQLGDDATSSLSDTAGVGRPRSASRDWFLLYPGDELAVNCSKFTAAGNIVVNFQAAFFRFSI